MADSGHSIFFLNWTTRPRGPSVAIQSFLKIEEQAFCGPCAAVAKGQFNEKIEGYPVYVSAHPPQAIPTNKHSKRYEPVKMNTPSFKFKKMICSQSRDDRRKIMDPILEWLQTQTSVDPMANACYNTIQEMFQVNSWADNKAFKEHYIWDILPNHNSCISFQEIVKAKGVPIKNVAIIIKTTSTEPRKAIPKKIRGETWTNHFGTSTKGTCFCCKKELDIFDDWHAGHIVPHSNGGTDTASNLRPVCGSCNLSMGTEHMDEFKARCYPTK